MKNVRNEADFSSRMQRLVQFIQGSMKILGIPISACLINAHRLKVLLIGGTSIGKLV